MQTTRLFLRYRTQELNQQILDASTEEQQRLMGIDEPHLIQSELVKIKKRIAEQTNWVKWDIIEQSSQKVIGSGGFHNYYPEHERSEIGYKLHQNFWGKGYMSEAIKPMVEYGFTQMKLNRMEAFTRPDNEPSIAILKKMGFKQEGILRGHYKLEDKIYDSLVFSLLRSEYIT